MEIKRGKYLAINCHLSCRSSWFFCRDSLKKALFGHKEQMRKFLCDIFHLISISLVVYSVGFHLKASAYSLFSLMRFYWVKLLAGFFYIVLALGVPMYGNFLFHSFSAPFFLSLRFKVHFCFLCMQSKLPFDIHESGECFEVNWISEQIVSSKELWHCIQKC